MKRRQTTEEEDYMIDIYKAKVEVALARWESGKYPKIKEKEVEEH